MGKKRRKIYTKKSINKIKHKIKLLGPNCKVDPITFLNIRLIISLIIFFTLLFVSSLGYIYAPIFTVSFYLLLEYFVLDYRIKLRARKLDYEALFFFEVLTLSLESGRNLKGAIDLTCKNIDFIAQSFNITPKDLFDEETAKLAKKLPPRIDMYHK